MRKIQNINKLKILSASVLTLLMIGSFFSPIVGSIQTNNDNEKINNFVKFQDKKVSNLLSSPSWPTTWYLLDTDPGEDGTEDDFRDVHYVYFNTDSDYIYLREECYGPAGWTYGDARYKIWFDLCGGCLVCLRRQVIKQIF